MADLLEPTAIDAALAELPPWSRQDDEIRASFSAPSFRAAIELVAAIADQAEEMNHHPDIDIRYTTVTLVLSTHSEGGITSADIELARRIDAVASTVGASPAD
jgi:4a-hydroxytetrahydrobiopterin dehydratase